MQNTEQHFPRILPTNLTVNLQLINQRNHDILDKNRGIKTSILQKAGPQEKDNTTEPPVEAAVTVTRCPFHLPAFPVEATFDLSQFRGSSHVDEEEHDIQYAYIHGMTERQELNGTVERVPRAPRQMGG